MPALSPLQEILTRKEREKNMRKNNFLFLKDDKNSFSSPFFNAFGKDSSPSILISSSKILLYNSVRNSTGKSSPWLMPVERERERGKNERVKVKRNKICMNQKKETGKKKEITKGWCLCY